MTSASEKFVKELRKFDKWNDIGGSGTQSTSKVTEEFVEICVKKVFPGSVTIKMGSQQHPDFAIIPPQDKKDFSKFVDGRKLTKSLVEAWEKQGNKVLWAEVKTAQAGVYTLNDTFPPSEEDGEELYIFFDVGNKKIHTVTSGSIHDIYGKKMGVDMSTLSKVSRQIVRDFQEKLVENWGETGVHTAARPTYRIDLELAHVDEIDPEKSLESLEKLLRKCGLS